MSERSQNVPLHVVIIGGGFGGLYAAKELGNVPSVRVTLIDKRNFHLFQPLLYQVATGGLSAGDISSPLRAVLTPYRNVQVLLGHVTDLDPQRQVVKMEEREIRYDALVVATGVSHHYFGNDHWGETAPGLKTIEDALEIRRRILFAFEAAEKELDPEVRRAWLTFIIAGAGPTGVELAGALAELAYRTLKEEFRSIDTSETRIILVEGADRVLPPYVLELSDAAKAALTRLGVDIRTGTFITDVSPEGATVRVDEQTEHIAGRTILWAAGVRASAMGKALAEHTGASLDRAGRVIVNANLSVSNYDNVFVVGDLAHYAHQDGKPLPGVAPVAMQQGRYMAELLKRRSRGQAMDSFRYTDQGSLAVIGRNAAVVDLGPLKLKGFPAWLIWTFVHIYFLIEFDNKLLVMMQWGWNYFTHQRGARLITGQENARLAEEASVLR